MISYPNLQSYYQPTYNQAYQSNYNQSFQPNYNNYSNYNSNFYQPNYNNYNTSLFQPSYNNFNSYNTYAPNNINNINNTNIFNNFNSPSIMAPQQTINIGGSYPMITQGQTINIGSTQQVAAPQQQDNSSSFLQQLVLMLLSVVLQEPEEPVEQTTVEHTRVWGDPHYEVNGKDGNLIKFDHKGTVGDTYNVFKGDGYQVNGTYVDNGNKLPIIGSTKIKAGADTIQYDGSGKTLLNGKALKDGSYKLNDGTKLEIKEGKASIKSREGDSQIDLSTDRGAITVTPTGDFTGLDGILGTALKENRALSEDESNKFDLTQKTKKK